MLVTYLSEEKSKNSSINEVFSMLDSCVDGLSSDEATSRREKLGANCLVIKQESELIKFMRYFWGPVPWMIEVAAALSVLSKDWSDLIIILSLLVFNAIIGFWEEHKAGNALEALKKQLALKARVKRDHKWLVIQSSELVVGDIIRVRPGDVVPADIRLFEGEYLSVDQSTLTGESLPVNKTSKDIAYSGSIVKQGEMVAIVTSTGSDTFFGHTSKLVENSRPVSHFQQAVIRVGNFLIVLAIVLSGVLAITGLIRGEHFSDLIQFILILIVASIPVAMPAVLTVTMALGAYELSKKKAIVSRLQAIEELAGVDILCSDKTGTLTQNKLTLGTPALLGAESFQELVLIASLASKAENDDPIDSAILSNLNDPSILDQYQQNSFLPFDPINKRTEAEISSPTKHFFVTKGAPQVIMDLCDLATEERDYIVHSIGFLASKGHRALGVAKKEEGQRWIFLGLLSLHDPLRVDSKITVEKAKENGISVKMITGDHLAVGRDVASELGLGNNLACADEFFNHENSRRTHYLDIEDKILHTDGFAEVFPEHKHAIVSAIQKKGHLVAMTGDGVNDAPALKKADVGIAVSGATDAAKSAADLILTMPGLSVIINAVEESRKIFERITSYTIYRITMTISIMFFVTSSIIAFNFYPLTPVMIILLALLDDIPIMTIAYDNAIVGHKPLRWEMKSIFTISIFLGLLSVVQTFLAMYIGKSYLLLDSAHVQSLVFLQLVIGGHLMLLVVRNKTYFWKRPYPSKKLFFAIMATQLLAILISLLGWFVPALSLREIIFIWLYNLIWLLLQDVTKVYVYKTFIDGIHHFTRRYHQHLGI